MIYLLVLSWILFEPQKANPPRKIVAASALEVAAFAPFAAVVAAAAVDY